MIFKIETDRILVDRESLAQLTGRSKNTIRAKLTPAKRDKNGRPLYNLHEAEKELQGIPQRPERRVA